VTTFAIKDNVGVPGPEWQLVKAYFKDHIFRVTEGQTTKLQKQRQYMIIQKRTGFGITSIKPDNDTYKSIFELATGPDTAVKWGWIGGGRRFLCTGDGTDVLDIKTGEAVQEQTWEHFSMPEDIADSAFQEATPS